MIWAAIGAVVATIAIVVIATRHNRGKTIVLGRQMAVAPANEAARLASGNSGPSPMPAGHYDQEGGDYDLVSVAERPLDRELQRVVRAFKTWAPERRAENRRRISMDEQYSLIQFAKRASVLALQEHSIARCEDGLLALAMIDETRIDYRDAVWAVGLLAHAIEATDADRDRLVDGAAAVATPRMAKILMRAKEHSVLSQLGYAEIRTETGNIGLVQSGSKRYEPSFDMSRLALRLAANLQRGRYIAEPELAVAIPADGFDEVHRASAEQLLKEARAGICIHGTLRKAFTDKPRAQQFVQWVVEMPSAEEANALVGSVGKDTRRGGRLIIGVASARLFCLLVAGSVMEGVPSYESRESLVPIANETRVLLQEAVR
jgi:hypothetical protein